MRVVVFYAVNIVMWTAWKLCLRSSLRTIISIVPQKGLIYSLSPRSHEINLIYEDIKRKFLAIHKASLSVLTFSFISYAKLLIFVTRWSVFAVCMCTQPLILSVVCEKRCLIAQWKKKHFLLFYVRKWNNSSFHKPNSSSSSSMTYKLRITKMLMIFRIATFLERNYLE